MKKDAGTETDTYDGGRSAAEYDLFTYVNQIPEHLVTIGNAMYWDGSSWVPRATGNLDPFTFLTYLDPDNPTLTGSADAMKNFNQAVIDKLKNNDDFVKAIKSDSNFPGSAGTINNLYVSRLADHNSDDFLRGYQSVFVDMYQGYLDAYNTYDKLLDAEIKGNTTSYMYGVQGENENWKTLNDKMNAALPSNSSTGYKYAYQDFINWLTAAPHDDGSDDMNTNRPLQGGLYALGSDGGLTSSTYVGYGGKGQKIPTSEKIWEYYSGRVFKDSGINGAPVAGDGSTLTYYDEDGKLVTCPDILLKLGRKISDSVLDSFKRVYAEGVKQAALDALQGKQMVVDYSSGISIGNFTPKDSDITLLTDTGYFKDGIFKNADLQYAFTDGYRFAKFWLTKNTPTLSTEPQNSFDSKNVDGYLVPSGPAKKPTGPSSKENPIDKAIISVLSGVSTTYNVIQKTGTNPAPTVTNDYAFPDSKDNYSAGHYINTIYDLATQIALQARADWTTQVEHQINGVTNSSKAAIDPNNDWYKMSPYVYATVFNALNLSYDSNDASKSWIVQALNKADKDVITSAAQNNGVPTITDSPIKVDVTDIKKIDLNASTYYNAADPKLLKSIGVNSYDDNGVATPIGTEANTKAHIKLGLDDSSSAKTTIQNVANYAYYHEQLIASAAFEAGYHAADANLNTKTGLPETAPTGDKYRFQYRSDFIGSMYPNSSDFSAVDGSKSTTQAASYANTDGTTTKLEVTYDADGSFTGVTT